MQTQIMECKSVTFARPPLVPLTQPQGRQKTIQTCQNNTKQVAEKPTNLTSEFDHALPLESQAGDGGVFTVEMVMDFHRNPPTHKPLGINTTAVFSLTCLMYNLKLRTRRKKTSTGNSDEYCKKCFYTHMKWFCKKKNL